MLFSNFYSNFWQFWQTLRGSFSAVSKPTFESKYSFESSWRDLQGLHAFAPLESNWKTAQPQHSKIQPNFVKLFQTFAISFRIKNHWFYFDFFQKVVHNLRKIHKIWWKLSGISAIFTEKSLQKTNTSSVLKFLRFRNLNCRIFQKIVFEQLEKRSKKLELEQNPF